MVHSLRNDAAIGIPDDQTAASQFFCPRNPKTSGAADNATNQIIHYILERMCEGVYLPGSHINENKISKELKISNIPIREAVERLIHIDLIERLPQRGLFVKKLSVRELDNIHEVRQDVETRIIRKLACSISDQQLSRLRKVTDILKQDEALFFEGQTQRILEGMESESFVVSQKNTRDPHPGVDEAGYYKWLKADIEFHMLLMHFTGNRVYEKIAESFIPRAILGYRFYFNILLDPNLQQLFASIVRKNQGQNVKLVYHEQIYHALETHDADLAEQLMRDHLTQFYYSKLAKMELLTHLNSIHSLMGPYREMISQVM
jgi:DNA-binding GntR family transcriptional regulator